MLTDCNTFPYPSDMEIGLENSSKLEEFPGIARGKCGLRGRMDAEIPREKINSKKEKDQ